jgi:intracellular sulfur oxidation DsrE/DsrF family protein
MHSGSDEGHASPIDAGAGHDFGATDRRDFLGRLGVGAAALAAASVGAGVPFAAAAAAEAGGRTANSMRTPWSDAWLQKLTGKHKQFFDATTTNESFALAFATGFLNLNHEAYGLEDKDLTAVVGLRHFAMPMALPDELWTKYKIGTTFQIKDPASGAPAERNPFLHADGVALPGSEMPTLLKRGVLFTVCNVALTVISGNLSKNAGVTKEAAKAEWTEKLLPGTTLVPVGVMAVNLAQEHGCTYCYGG